MSDNKKTVVLATLSPVDDVVARCEELLDMARSGELRTLSFIGVLTDNRTYHGTVGRHSNRQELAGLWLAQAVNHVRGF